MQLEATFSWGTASIENANKLSGDHNARDTVALIPVPQSIEI